MRRKPFAAASIRDHSSNTPILCMADGAAIFPSLQELVVDVA